MRHHVVLAVDNIFTPTYDSKTRLRSSLGIGTATDYWHPTRTASSNFYASHLENLHAYTLQPSKCSRTLHLDSDSFDICIDTGASSTCTMSMDDFVPGTYRKLTGYSINGISSGLSVLGYGTVRWVLYDDSHVPIDVEIDRVLLIRDLPMRLLSPQQLARQTNGLRDGFYVHGSTAQLIFGGFTKTISYNLRNNLPVMSSYPGITKFSSYAGTLVADGSLRDNLTYNQRQLLKWHNRLGHMDFSRIQKFSRLGLLPRELSTVRPQDYPVCPACQYGKQKRSHRISNNTDHVISSSDDKPGD